MTPTNLMLGELHARRPRDMPGRYRRRQCPILHQSICRQALGPVFPYGTLFINVVGSLIVGFFMMWTSERVLADPRWRLLIVVGFCGSLHYILQLRVRDHGLLRSWTVAAFTVTNIFSNNFLCLGRALAGMALARVL